MFDLRRVKFAWRLVAFFGGICYTMQCCAAMGGRIPATERDNGIKKFPRPVNGLPRPVVYSTRLRGAGFCKWR